MNAKWDIVPATPPIVREQRRLLFRRKKIPMRVLVRFTRDLAIMLSTRLMLSESLRILAQQNAHGGFQQVLRHIDRQINAGRSLAESLRQYPAIFNPFYVNLVEVGELTGSLGEMLERVATYLEKIADLRRKLVQALTYPVLVIGVAIASLGFIMLYVIPTFAGIFRDFNAQLPLPTRIVMEISRLIQENLLFFILGGALLVAGGRLAGSFPVIQRLWDRLLLNIPLIGELVRKNHISQFCRTLGTLREGGVSLLNALDIASRSTQNHYIRRDILAMKHYAAKGEKLTASLKQSRVFPLMVTQMLAVGEETAELPFMLLKIADFYDREIDSAIETLASVIEPIVIVLLGGIIGAILVSIYLPLFNMTNVMGG